LNAVESGRRREREAEEAGREELRRMNVRVKEDVRRKEENLAELRGGFGLSRGVFGEVRFMVDNYKLGRARRSPTPTPSLHFQWVPVVHNTHVTTRDGRPRGLNTVYEPRRPSPVLVERLQSTSAGPREDQLLGADIIRGQPT
jgi:hypothetical protein